MIALQIVWGSFPELRCELIGDWRGASLRRPSTIRSSSALNADDVSGAKSNTTPVSFPAAVPLVGNDLFDAIRSPFSLHG